MSLQDHSAAKPDHAAAEQDNAAANADLIEAIAAGDARAAAAMFERFAPLVRTLLRRQLGPSEDVQDLTQEVFLRLFRKVRARALRDPAALRSFVVGFALRVARAQLSLRWVRRWLQLAPRGRLPESSAAPGDFAAREALSRLYGLLDRLAPETRMLFVLRYVEEWEVNDIARALRVSHATAKRRLAKSSARVFKLIERDPVLADYFGGDAKRAEDEREGKA